MPPSQTFPDRQRFGVRRGPNASRLTLGMVIALVAGLAVTGVFSSAVSGLESALTRGAGSPAADIAYVPRQLLVSYSGAAAGELAFIRARTGIDVSASGKGTDTPGVRLLDLPAGVSVTAAAEAIAKLPGVGYADPNYLAFAAGSVKGKAADEWIPNDPGIGDRPEGWERLQWNFLPAEGVNAPQAWANLIADHRPGARGVIVAVLDSGVAYRNWGAFKRSPDFSGTKFVSPCDLIAGTIKNGHCTDPYALDRLGHGTFVAGTIAETTNNNYGVTGLAYHASIMPVRVLNANGAGSVNAIAAGVRYAVQHGARVINLSLEFPPGTQGSQIPELISAINFAHAHGVVVVAAAGNDYGTNVDFPAAAQDVVAVGATTADGCLAAYSDSGHAIALVAPGGGYDSATLHTPNCHPTRVLPDVYQMTFADGGLTTAQTSVNVDQFAIQSGWFGTSMASPDVAAAAAMVIASGVLGPDPTPAAILARLEATARHLGPTTPNTDYGYGLVNIGAATAKGGPGTTTTTTTPTTTTTVTTTTTTPTTTTTTTTGGTTP